MDRETAARWTVGGVVVAIVWLLYTIAIGITIISSTADYIAMALWVILPFAVLGLAWGWHERRALRRASARDPEGLHPQILDAYHFVQGGKGAICGLLFGVFFAALNAFTRLDYSFTESISVAIAGTGVGAIVGVLAGIVAGANLRRRVRRALLTDGPGAAL